MSATASRKAPRVGTLGRLCIGGAITLFVASVTMAVLFDVGINPIKQVPEANWFYACGIAAGLVALALRGLRNRSGEDIQWLPLLCVIIVPLIPIAIIDAQTEVWQKEWVTAQAIIIALMLLATVVHIVLTFPIRSLTHLPHRAGMSSVELVMHLVIAALLLNVGARTMAEQEMIQIKPDEFWQKLEGITHAIIPPLFTVAVPVLVSYILAVIAIWVVGLVKKTKKSGTP